VVPELIPFVTELMLLPKVAMSVKSVLISAAVKVFE